MRVRIAVRPSKVRDSEYWHYDVEEFILGKWRMAYFWIEGEGHHYFCGMTDDKEKAINLSREKAAQYIELRKEQETLWRDVEKPQPYVEEIKIEQT